MLVRGVGGAGTPFLIAKDISTSLIHKLTENPPIDNHRYSSKIREHGAEESKQRNRGATAQLYIRYSKNTVTAVNEEQLHDSKYDSKVSQAANTKSKQFAKDMDNFWNGIQDEIIIEYFN